MFTHLQFKILPGGHFLILPRLLGVTDDEMTMLMKGQIPPDRFEAIIGMMKKEITKFQKMETVGTA